jgi:hypothetical protein
MAGGVERVALTPYPLLAVMTCVKFPARWGNIRTESHASGWVVDQATCVSSSACQQWARIWCANLALNSRLVAGYDVIDLRTSAQSDQSAVTRTVPARRARR